MLSVDSPLAGPQCGAAPVSKSATTGKDPAGTWEGTRVLDVSDPQDPRQVAAVYQDCGSHTNTLLPAPSGKSMYVLNSSYPLGEGPTCGPLGEAAGRKINHGVDFWHSAHVQLGRQGRELVASRHPGAGPGPLPARQRVLPRRLVRDRLQRPGQHVVRVHVPAPHRPLESDPAVLQRRAEPQLRHGHEPELPRGGVRLHALPRGGSCRSG